MRFQRERGDSAVKYVYVSLVVPANAELFVEMVADDSAKGAKVLDYVQRAK